MSNQRLALWLSLGALFIILLNLPPAVIGGARQAAREAMAPLQGAVTGFWRSLREGLDSVRGLNRQLRENQRLTAETARLVNQVRELQALGDENAQLRRQLGFAARAPRELVACEIIAREGEGWWQTLRLNRGTQDGVAVDMAVVTVDGLAGRTIGVSAHTADVLLVSDPGCRVAARVKRTGSFGVVSGRGPAWSGQVICRMEFINKNAPLLPGDEVYTSGLGGLFPKGLLIGYIENVFMDRSGLYQHADVVTKADLGLMQYVFVVREAPAHPLHEAPAAAGRPGGAP